MRRILFSLIFIYMTSLQASSQSGPRTELNFTTIDGFTMDAKMFADKYLILTTFDISNINQSVLVALDTIQKKYYKKVIVIGIPLADSSSKTSKSQVLSLIRDSLHLSFPITPIVTSKTLRAQNLLLRLANDSTKSHFPKKDLLNQTWILNSSGTPFSYFMENQLLSYGLVEKLLMMEEKRED